MVGSRLKKVNASAPVSGEAYGTVTYDAVWAMGLALQNVITTANISIDLSASQYGVEYFRDLLYDALRLTNFTGVSGDVAFDANGNAKTYMGIYQLRFNEKVLAGIYRPAVDLIEWIQARVCIRIGLAIFEFDGYPDSFFLRIGGYFVFDKTPFKCENLNDFFFPAPKIVE